MRRTRHRTVTLLLLLVLLVAGCDYVERVSVNRFGSSSGGGGLNPVISADGRHVAFWSAAPDLVPGDSNEHQDVFVRDVRTNATTRASVDMAGGDANADSFYPSISADGRFVAFASRATDLVTGDTSSLEDIFVRDLVNQTTTRVTVDTGGGAPDALSESSRISADGRHVVYVSAATDLVLGDFNGVDDVFVRDLDAATTTRASVDTGGGDPDGPSGLHAAGSSPAIDADGSRVVFQSAATDLIPVDGNGAADVFVRDLDAASTTRASVDTSGGDPDGPSDARCGKTAISDDGNIVGFCSFATDLVAGDGSSNADVFVRDLNAGTTAWASEDTSGGAGASLSADGRYVAFQTTGIFVHDVKTGSTIRADAWLGRGGDGISGDASMSGDGRYVTFHTLASNLHTGQGNADTNGGFDVYVRAVSMPRIESVTPHEVAAGSSATLRVLGRGFLPDAVATASVLTPPGVTIDEVTVISETELELSVRVAPDAPPGPRLLVVWNPGTGPGSGEVSFGLCVECLTVT
jgi:Tol biopolymer transport system component